MTIIPHLSEELSSDALPGASGQLAKQKAKWLHELERAQWEVKQRPQPQAQNASKTATNDNPTPQNSAQTHVKHRGETVTQGQNKQMQSDSPVHPTSAPGTATAFPPSTKAGTIQQVAAIANASVLPINTVASSALSVSSSLALGISASSAQRQWEKQRAHLEQKDGEVRMWLRDTQVDEAQGLELAMALRKRFAELGLRLARFTLNGHAIAQEDLQQTIHSNQ